MRNVPRQTVDRLLVQIFKVCAALSIAAWFTLAVVLVLGR